VAPAPERRQAQVMGAQLISAYAPIDETGGPLGPPWLRFASLRKGGVSALSPHPLPCYFLIAFLTISSMSRDWRVG
jgi:hypothetical protein